MKNLGNLVINLKDLLNAFSVKKIILTETSFLFVVHKLVDKSKIAEMVGSLDVKSLSEFRKSVASLQSLCAD